jgi:hypothetical protein
MYFLISDEHVYVATQDDHLVRMNFDGSGLVTLVYAGDISHALDLDLENRYLYWGDRISATLKQSISTVKFSDICTIGGVLLILVKALWKH